MTDPLAHLTAHGVAVWLDNLDRRDLDFAEVVSFHAWNVTGIIGNPTIFQASIGDGTRRYARQQEELRRQGAVVDEVLQALTTHDVRRACDLLRPTHEASGGIEGYVSVEVSPLVPHDIAGTLAEARRLQQLVDRPSVVIKVPATGEGAHALRLLLAEGRAHGRPPVRKGVLHTAPAASASRGRRPHRPLWALTATKTPATARPAT